MEGILVMEVSWSPLLFLVSSPHLNSYFLKTQKLLWFPKLNLGGSLFLVCRGHLSLSVASRNNCPREMHASVIQIQKEILLNILNQFLYTQTPMSNSYILKNVIHAYSRVLQICLVNVISFSKRDFLFDARHNLADWTSQEYKICQYPHTLAFFRLFNCAPASWKSVCSVTDFIEQEINVFKNCCWPHSSLKIHFALLKGSLFCLDPRKEYGWRQEDFVHLIILRLISCPWGKGPLRRSRVLIRTVHNLILNSIRKSWLSLSYTISIHLRDRYNSWSRYWWCQVKIRVES